MQTFYRTEHVTGSVKFSTGIRKLGNDCFQDLYDDGKIKLSCKATEPLLRTKWNSIKASHLENGSANNVIRMVLYIFAFTNISMCLFKSSRVVCDARSIKQWS